MKEQKEIHIGSLIKEKMEERDFRFPILPMRCIMNVPIFIRYLSEAVLMWICYCVYRKS